MQIIKKSTCLKHIPHMADIELIKRAHFSQLLLASVKIVGQDTSQHVYIPVFSNQKPSTEMQNFEKANATCAA